MQITCLTKDRNVLKHYWLEYMGIISPKEEYRRRKLEGKKDRKIYSNISNSVKLYRNGRYISFDWECVVIRIVSVHLIFFRLSLLVQKILLQSSWCRIDSSTLQIAKS